MLRTTKTALLAALMVAAVSTHAAAQEDPEAGDIRVDLPARKAPPRDRDEPQIRTRKQVGEVGPLRVYGGFQVAVGGEVQVEDFGGIDADPTIGIQGGVDYVLHEYFSIGGEMRLLWFKADTSTDRTLLWDLVVKPRGRYAFNNIPLEVYGTLPIGLTVPGDIQLPAAGEVNGKAGFTVGLAAGANWFFTQHLGVNAEIGWQFHKIRAEEFGASAEIKLNQLVLLCPNFVYAF
ncbi:MAG TPA: outer membrane beta-barrel protein [Polyangiales bacterium]|nr:outer membrane beta-barrel protein [Polyangiales bacterium]